MWAKTDIFSFPSPFFLLVRFSISVLTTVRRFTIEPFGGRNIARTANTVCRTALTKLTIVMQIRVLMCTEELFFLSWSYKIYPSALVNYHCINGKNKKTQDTTQIYLLRKSVR
jgi:hypothetical protein